MAMSGSNEFDQVPYPLEWTIEAFNNTDPIWLAEVTAPDADVSW